MIMKGLLNTAIIGIVAIFSSVLSHILNKIIFGDDQNSSDNLIFLIIYSSIMTMVYIFVDPFLSDKFKNL